MVLIRILCVLLVIAGIAGCNQSLFDAFGDRPDGGGSDGGGGDGPDVPASCPQTCVADAVKDFDEPASPWRYIEDGPGYLWPLMTRDVREWFGTEPNNRFKLCRENPSASACEMMRDALLVLSAGNSSAFVPALELKSAGARVLHLIVRAYVPGNSAEHKIRLYRNSREDVLFTELAMPGGTMVARDIIVDALPDDRFVVAIEPTSALGGTAALDFFVSDQGDPSACQFAASFTVPAGNGIDDLCSDRDLTFRMGAAPGTPVPPMLIDVGGPFQEQGRFANIPLDHYFTAPDTAAQRLVRNDTLTVQFWVRVNSLPVSGKGWIFSDLDEDLGGGSGLAFFDNQAPKLEVSGAIAIPPSGSPAIISNTVPFTLGAWHFVRMVDTPSSLIVCVDGSRKMSLNVTSDRPQTNYAFHLGKHPFDASRLFAGAIDDVRVFARALPCEQTN